MKKLVALSIMLLVMISSLFVVSCKDDEYAPEPGEKMLYTEDTELGTGNTTFTLIVKHIDGKQINFTINTSKTILSDALIELNLVKGHDDTYGFYIDKVNGITQSYNTDKTYWAIYEGESYASSGLDGITIVNGATYKLVASK